MKNTKITYNIDGFDTFIKESENYRARVGILGGDVARKDGDTTLTNSEIGMIQQFGSITDHIPPRDFLVGPIKGNSKELTNTMNKSTKLKAAVESMDFKEAFKILGVAAEAIVKTGFTNAGYGQWAPNSPVTIAKKGSSAPLIDSGQLSRSITSDVVTGNS